MDKQSRISSNRSVTQNGNCIVLQANKLMTWKRITTVVHTTRLSDDLKQQQTDRIAQYNVSPLLPYQLMSTKVLFHAIYFCDKWLS